ncbi:BAG family molecular chaperone regulator 2 [Halotydeus destructor]|nr:BAG family molecular chaperone regulator 2 [Halotydeus destructor]
MDFVPHSNSGSSVPFGQTNHFVEVTSYQRSISNTSSQPSTPGTDFMDLPPLVPLQMPPLPQLVPLTLPPLPQPFFVSRSSWYQPQHQPMRMSQAKGKMGSSQETGSSGYASGSSSSSLFPSMRKAPSEHSVLLACSDNVQLVQDEGQLMRRYVLDQQNVQRHRQRSTSNSSRARSNSSSSSKRSKGAFLKESLIKVLDQIDSRVSFLRETANELEEEKRKLSETLSNVESNNELSEIEEVDREEILITAQRLVKMLNTVHVQVATIRNKEQQLALETVNSLIANVTRMSEGKDQLDKARQLVKLYLNTCSSESHNLTVDEKFQKALIGCTIDDQKRIRKRLEVTLANMGKGRAN